MFSNGLIDVQNRKQIRLTTTTKLYATGFEPIHDIFILVEHRM